MKKDKEYDEFEELDDDIDMSDDISDDVDVLDDDLNMLDEDLGDSSDNIESDSNEDDDDDDDVDVMVKFNTNNHKLEGKHSLSRDTIFKGKTDDPESECEYNMIHQDDFNMSDGLPIEVGSSYEFESKYHEDYMGRLNLSRDIYDLLKNKTDLDFSANRRKPNRHAFNDYYRMLLNNIGKEYTKSEIFVELSYYFTDNIFNMFKLLDKEYATHIIVELKQRGYLTNLNNINFI